MKLYELSDMYQNLQHQIEEGEIPEEAICDTLESMEGELKIKADNIACMVKNLRAEAEMIESEAIRQLNRAEIKLRKAQKMQEYLKDQLLKCDIAKIETPRNKIQIRNNLQKMEILEGFKSWAQKEADQYLRYSEPQPNKTAIKEAMQRGVIIPFVKFKTDKRIEIK